ncbi:hypothetical protein AVEN_218871-1 [Araneus ventricosus]|uniref:Histone-lysine N-methyltransferase SETMAR n=1 Tax=Araneus ventricosus TaxID=182803 RepID=A0A4Y2PZV6_ARAVE|nr:hypothetical protein AVEN_90438-1 [Araneus ventricosus]GBN56791.1 hypothetical protein AVEN_218871-1 [Araneus ventricosus]
MKRMGLSLQHLMRWQAEFVSFLRRIVTGDETWAHHVTRETKKASMSWRQPSSPPIRSSKLCHPRRKLRPQCFSTTRVCCRSITIRVERPRMLTVIATRRTSAQGISQETTRTALERCLVVARQRPAHTASVTHGMKQRFRWNALEHPTCSPDLVPSDFHLFGPLKKYLTGRHFGINADVQDAVVKCLRVLNPDFLRAGFDRLVSRWHKYFNNHGDYVEK